ncbi:ComF family protein [Lactiplantibacillus garii]|uniref:ComF family protein n=1 Tax=Lactiplantibacillus garii TaxID=2306423 RepID=UPI001CDBCF7D|nr:ComF family protein [Lactiplantibacillus garii]
MCQRLIQSKFSLPWLLSWRPFTRPVVCAVCWQRFKRIERRTACPGCGRDQTVPRLCPDCQRWPAERPFHNVALFTYNDAMRAYFQQYKFHGDYRLRRVFEGTMQTALHQLNGDLVLIIPVTPSTLLSRGFNQVSGWLSDGLNQPRGLQTLAREKGVPQSKKVRQDRLRTPQPFMLALAAEQIQGKRVVVIDDIYTTGRTIRHAADLLLESGAKSVTGLTLAR